MHRPSGVKEWQIPAGAQSPNPPRTPRRADPDEEQVRQHMDGNLCRCTGYHNIVKAVLQAAGSGSATATQGSEQA